MTDITKQGVPMTKIIQLDDDLDLLDSMIQDQKKADELYRPTNYWETYMSSFLPELRKKGLRDFRRRKFSVMGTFGATDINLLSIVNLPQILQTAQKTKLIWRFVPNVVSILEKILKPIRKLYEKQINSEIVVNAYYPYAKENFLKKGWDISKFSMTLIGNPDEAISVDGKYWSRHHLDVATIFIDAMIRSDFKDGDFFCEIGPGCGRNVEFFATAFPHSTMILFDIAPQLYVSNQYLKKRFQDRFIPYEEGIKLKVSDKSKWKGKIILLPTWHIEKWSTVPIDYFWNSASFQEMEIPVVSNYLSLVKKMKPNWIYINALPNGNYWGEWHAGQGGTKAPIKEEIYTMNLKDQYELKEKYYTKYMLRTNDHNSHIFKRKSKAD